MRSRSRKTANRIELVLASQSIARKRLLTRLLALERRRFRTTPAGLDEDSIIANLLARGVRPASIARKLAQAKARAVAKLHPQAAIIGSDQMVAFRGKIYGKPGSPSANRAQLRAFSGQAIELLTAVCVLRDDFEKCFVQRTRLRFRALSEREIRDYVALDRPWDCAGGFKFEEHGQTLLSEVKTDDPTGIEGLPILRLGALLREASII